MKSRILGFAAGLLITVQSFAQITEGSVTFDMTMSSNDEQVQMQFDMMGTSKMVMIFKEKNYMSEMTNMFMVQKTIYNEKEDKAMMLSEMMGRKTAVNMTNEELKEKNDKEKGDKSKSEVTKLEEYKDILGYKCQKMISKNEAGSVVMYVTKDIAPKSNNSAFVSEDVEGFPLEIITESNQGGYPVTITMIAKSVKTEIKDKDPFSLAVPKGYKEMSYSDFQNEMKAMRGGN
ncbi:MAG: DUF4412 domain-containing protein [Bacteroidetes bacterium]|nr:DUF4412 domain-containing protein [Bacteroidota bacterium]